MNDFTSVAESNACATGSKLVTITYQFAEGSIVYSIDKAQKGIVYAIGIKQVKIINNKKTYGKNVFIYVDKYNSLWNEWDLCTEVTARQLAIAYWQNRQAELEALLQECQL